MTINLITTQHSVHHGQVEWDVLCKIIAQFAYFDTNKTSLTSTLFVGQWAELVEEFTKTQSYLTEIKDEYRQVMQQLLQKLPENNSLEKHLGYISKKGILNFGELNKLTLLMECTGFIQSEFPRVNIPHFQKIRDMDLKNFQRKFLREFRHLVDESGEVHYEKHPELAELSRRLRELEERIRKTIQEWINESQNNKILQYASYDVHFDRYVVPVRSDSYRSDIGMIVSRSESGQTLFVEPVQIRDFCNKRLEMIAKIDEIINQLAMKFSFALHDHWPLITEGYSQVVLIDYFLAKSGFATRYTLECPSIKSSPGFKFTQLFHPLVKNAVKNNADCNQQHHGIVISGPNTGGKTVFLKSISIAYLLFYHGFFVPAAEAEMYPYEGLFYFGNDLQDLKTGLSSFSGEVKNYIDLLENISPSNLILIDEIFNSTSSDEASALSLAYFEELHRRAGCHIVVSTHHQMFKTLIHQDHDYLSCHVGFDTKNMKPTYKIQWGTPGASMAIDIFRILSRDHQEVKNVPDRALTHLSAKNVSYETLLQKVSQKQIELDQILTSNRQLEVELKNQKGAMEGVLSLRLNEELGKARKEIDKILNEARELVEEARRNEITKVRKVDDKALQLRAKIRELRGEEPEIEELSQHEHLDISLLKPGEMVYSFVLKKEFLVHSVDHRKKEVTIGKGPIKINVPAHTLGTSNKAPLTAKVSVSFQKNNDAKFEFDVRGLRLSEFQNIVENAVADLLAGDVPYVNIIHGHGDGILKNWLRDYLKRSKDFRGEIPENGNDGETKITIK